jgi:hypothetical protein
VLQGAWHSCRTPSDRRPPRISSSAPSASRSARAVRLLLAEPMVGYPVVGAPFPDVLLLTHDVSRDRAQTEAARHRPRSTVPRLLSRRVDTRDLVTARQLPPATRSRPRRRPLARLRLLECGSERSRGIASDDAAALQTGKVVDGAEWLRDAPMRVADSHGKISALARWNARPLLRRWPSRLLTAWSLVRVRPGEPIRSEG